MPLCLFLSSLLLMWSSTAVEQQFNEELYEEVSGGGVEDLVCKWLRQRFWWEESDPQQTTTAHHSQCTEIVVSRKRKTGADTSEHCYTVRTLIWISVAVSKPLCNCKLLDCIKLLLHGEQLYDLSPMWSFMWLLCLQVLYCLMITLVSFFYAFHIQFNTKRSAFMHLLQHVFVEKCTRKRALQLMQNLNMWLLRSPLPKIAFHLTCEKHTACTAADRLEDIQRLSNALSHTWHLYAFSPLWILLCLTKCPTVVNCLLQTVHKCAYLCPQCSCCSQPTDSSEDDKRNTSWNLFCGEYGSTFTDWRLWQRQTTTVTSSCQPSHWSVNCCLLIWL